MEPRDGSAENTGESRITATDVDSGDPTRLVRHGTEMHVDHLMCDPVIDLRTVASGPHTLGSGQLMIVDDDPTRGPYRYPRL